MNATECFAYRGVMSYHTCECTNAIRCPLTIGEPCSFFKTKAEYAAGIERSEARIATLPEERRKYIVETYLVPFRMEKKKKR